MVPTVSTCVRRGVMVSASEYRLCGRRVSWWVVTIAAAALGFLFCTPAIRLFAGDGAATEGVRVARNTTYAMSVALNAVAFLMMPVVASITAEAAVRDARTGLQSLVAAGPVRRAAYLLQKWAGATAAALTPLAVFAASVAAAQTLPNRGVALVEWNVLPPIAALLQHGVPFVLVVSAMAFTVTIRSAEPRRAYGVVALLAVATLSLYSLPARPEYRWAIAVDPVGFLHLGDLARGLTNADLNGLTWLGGKTFVWNRLALIAVTGGLLGVMATTRLDTAVGSRRRRDADAGGDEVATTCATVDAGSVRPGNATRWLAQLVGACRAELRLVRGGEALVIFAPVFLMLTWYSLGRPTGPFNADSVAVTAVLVEQSVWVVMAALCLFALFVATESTVRDRDVALSDIVHVSSAHDASLVAGKLVATLLVVMLLLAGATVVVAGYQFLQGGGLVQARPFLDLYGLIVLPVVLVVLSGAILSATATRSRHATYAVVVVVTGAYAWAWWSGHRHWVYNWPAAGLFTYSDLAGFGLVGSTVSIQRAYVAAVAALALWAAVVVGSLQRRSWSPRQRSLYGGGAVFGLLVVVLGGVLVGRVESGMWSRTVELGQALYEREAKGWLPSRAQPDVTAVDLELDLYPATNEFKVQGTFELSNLGPGPVRNVYVTVNPRLLRDGVVRLDAARGTEVIPGLLEFELPNALESGARARLTFGWRGRAPDGVPAHGGRFSGFVDSQAVLLTSNFRWPWLAVVGYSAEAEILDNDRRRQHGLPSRVLFARGTDAASNRVGFLNRNVPFRYRAVVRAPSSLPVISSGRLASVRPRQDRTEYEYVSERPIYSFAIAAGTWMAKRRGDHAVWFYEAHRRSVMDILDTTAGATQFFGDVFRPLPYPELAVAEVPQFGVWGGMAFPGLVVLSEDLGFLTRETAKRANLNVFAVAHEVAHQWWGTAVWPAHAPGALALVEGLATYSALLYVERALGETRRRALFEDLEYFYLRNRQPGNEQALVAVDGTRYSDTAVMYHRAALVFYMLSRMVGVDKFLAMLSDFYDEFAFRRVHPTVADLLSRLEGRGPTVRAFLDEFIHGTAVPNVAYAEVSKRRQGDGRWVVTFQLVNRGGGAVEVVVEARGQRPEHRSRIRARVTGGPTPPATVTLECDFEPRLLEIDPDRTVLLQRRGRAMYRF